MIGAHCFSYELNIGSRNGLQVLHKCDNKLCVRPDHLFLGTQKDNMHDMIKKGRAAYGDKLNHPSQHGENNPQAKLTKELVKKIRSEYKSGIRQCDLMKKYSVPRANIWAIVHNKSWTTII